MTFWDITCTNGKPEHRHCVAKVLICKLRRNVLLDICLQERHCMLLLARLNGRGCMHGEGVLLAESFLQQAQSSLQYGARHVRLVTRSHGQTQPCTMHDPSQESCSQLAMPLVTYCPVGSSAMCIEDKSNHDTKFPHIYNGHVYTVYSSYRERALASCHICYFIRSVLLSANTQHFTGR